jgi:hypothetical protein
MRLKEKSRCPLGVYLVFISDDPSNYTEDTYLVSLIAAQEVRIGGEYSIELRISQNDY